MASPTLHLSPQFDDEEYFEENEVFAVNAGRHLQELDRLSAFQQVRRYHQPTTAAAVGSPTKMPSMAGRHHRVRA